MKQKVSILLCFIFFSLLFCGCSKAEEYTLPPYNQEALTALTEGITTAEKAAYDQIITTEVVVIGSDPEGIAAAVAAARNGLDTRLIDFERATVGGLYTLGWLNMIDLNYTEKNGKESINQGIFAEILAANNQKTSFTVKKMEEIFLNLLQEAEVTVTTDYDANWELQQQDNTITGLILHQDGKKILLKALQFIDATQNADISRKAGVPYYDGLEELGLTGERGCDTLVFQLQGVDWKQIKSELQNDNNPDTGADNTSAWGYSEIRDCEISDPDIYMRGPNIGLQEDGSILLNGLQIFHLDIHDSGAMGKARERIIYTLEEEIIPYMRQNFAGWEEAELVAVAPEFYIRESYHLKTIDRLTGEDVFQSNFPEYFIASGSYAIDLQARSKGLYGIALYGTSPYGISFGVMVPENIANLLSASRCAGYDAIAAGSARTVPVGTALGQAAGVGAAYAIINGEKDYRKMIKEKENLANIKFILNSQGAKLQKYYQTKTQVEVENSKYYDAIRYLRGKGILTCGYSNDYQLKETATKTALNSICYAMSSNSPYEVPTLNTIPFAENEAITTMNLPLIFSAFLGQNYSALETLVAAEILDDAIYHDLTATETITNEVFYGAMAQLVKYMEQAGTRYYAAAYKGENLATASEKSEEQNIQ